MMLLNLLVHFARLGVSLKQEWSQISGIEALDITVMFRERSAR